MVLNIQLPGPWQFMSVLIQDKVQIEQKHIYLDPRISFHEIPQYFFSGCACAYFQVGVQQID